MKKLFNMLKRKIYAFLYKKTLLDKVDELEAQIDTLEAKIYVLERSLKKYKAQSAQADTTRPGCMAEEKSTTATTNPPLQTEKASPASSSTAAQPDKEPEKPYGTKISAITKDGIEFYWKKPEFADGYEVFRAYKQTGPWEKIAVIEKRSVGTHTDAQFDTRKQSIFYAIRSYCNLTDGSRVYSDMTTPTEAVFRDRLTVERTATYLYTGTTRNIRAFWGWGEPEQVTWSSDNESVATISQDGIITAHSSGSCTLTCECPQIRQTATTQVVVDRKACEPLGPITSRFLFDEASKCWKNAHAKVTNDAVIMMVGDMMCGKRQMQTQVSPDGGWNFNDSFEYVKEITADADFSIGNLETLLAAGWPYMLDETYIDNTNNCNATSRYLDAVRYGGFDAVAMSNNHNCDGGRLALLETIDQVDQYHFAHTGVFRNNSEDRFFIANVNGIKVGFVSYISKDVGFNGKDATWTRSDKNTLLNIFTQEKAAQDIAACRNAGAEYVIAYMHWGFKNFRNVARHQFDDAKKVAQAGADYIVGSNPHMVQSYELLTMEDGRTVPCAYSIGNFQAVMNQVKGNRDSVILRIRLQKDALGNVVLAENNYIPCYTYTQFENSNWAPVALSKQFHANLKKKNQKSSLGRIVSTMGDQIQPL